MVENFEYTDDIQKRDTWETLKQDPEFNEQEIVSTFNEVSPDAIKWIDLWYEDIKKNPNFIVNLINQYEWDNSLTGLLAQNEQIQLLLDDILSDYWNYIKQDETALRRIIQEKKNNDPEEWSMVECFEEYLLNNDSQEWFEQFLLSNKCITNVILSYFNGLINWETKELNTNLISIKNIKAKIKSEWYKKLYTDYNEWYDLKIDDHTSQLRDIGNLFKNMADNLVSIYLNWSEDGNFLSTLEWFINNTRNNENFRQALESDHFNFLLRNSIKEYSRLIDTQSENLKLTKTNDRVFDAQLRTYLFMYWMLFYPDIFKSKWWSLDNYESDLWNILEAILIADWNLDGTENNEGENLYIQAERSLQTERRKRDKEMRQNALRMRRSGHDVDGNLDQILDRAENSNLDIQNASWVEIAQDMELWKSLNGFKMKESQYDADIIFTRKNVFKRTCRKYKEVFNQFNLKISDIFALNNNDFSLAINQAKLKELTDTLDASRINEIKILINWFINEFNNSLEEIGREMEDKKEAVHNVVKEYAIWAVIDNIKDMFQNIVGTSSEWTYISWFEFNEKESAKIEDNKLILSGKFNWETLVIKYDLNNWELYMNSYISEISNNTMVIWDKSPNLKVWELQPFQDILDSFYESPTESMSNDVFSKYVNTPTPQQRSGQDSNDGWERQHSPRKGIEARKRMREEHKQKIQQICGTKLEDISWNVKDQVETRTTQDYVASNLLKTLNIMPEYDDYDKIINIENSSDLYKTIQTITNSTNEDINYFSNYLWKLMNYIWLKWGKNNLFWQDKTTEDAKLIFNSNNSEKTVKYLRDKTGNFYDEYSNSNGKLLFDAWTTFGILGVINEKFVEWESPNWKLKRDRIDTFNLELTKDLKNYTDMIQQQKEMDISREIIAVHDKKTEEEQMDADEFLEEQLLSIA